MRVITSSESGTKVVKVESLQQVAMGSKGSKYPLHGTLSPLIILQNASVISYADLAFTDTLGGLEHPSCGIGAGKVGTILFSLGVLTEGPGRRRYCYSELPYVWRSIRYVTHVS